jgi:transcription elongation factor Elf1
MQLQVNYQCDICSQSFLLDFSIALAEKKLKCSNCGVVYKFTEKELDEFNQCYRRLLDRLKNNREEQKIRS